MDAQLQLEKFSDNKIAQMLTSQKCSSDKTGLEYVATDSSNIASTCKIVFLKPNGSDPQNDKGKAMWFLVRMIILLLRSLSILQREAYLHVIIVG
jgi:hypothetical protein